MPPRAPSLLLDPQLAPADQSFFAQPFDDGPASIRLGPGWQEPEKAWPKSPGRPIAWAQQVACVYFGVPLAPAADLVVVAVPMVYPGAPPQVLRPTLNGTRLPDLPMPNDWTELRIPLPPPALASPINFLELRFAYEVVPAKMGLGSDERRLAAAFDLLAVVPHDAPLPAHLPANLPAAAAAGHDEALRLSRWPTAVPVPPARRVEVQLGPVHAAGPGVRLGIDLESWDNRRRPLWHGAADDAGGRSLVFSVGEQRPARLLLQLEGDGAPQHAAPEAPWMAPPAIHADPAVEPPAERPDIFVYLVDTLRADSLGVYGSRRPTSPRIDDFSRDAVVFDRAYSASAWTLPATFSMLSGLYPSHHGVTLPGERLAEDREPWLPDLLSRQGYETLGITQWLLGGDLFGLVRGFGHFYLDVRAGGKNPSDAARWYLWRYLLRRRNPENPLFTYLHVVDPHALYRPRGEDARFAREHPGKLPLADYDPNIFLTQGLGRDRAEMEHMRALYDGEVHAADRSFGTFLDLLRFFGLYDRSVIVLLSDHGEEFGEHGGWNHGRTLYDELLRVPLIVKLPRSLHAGTRVADPVSLVDVAPTLAALAGAGGAGAGFDGLPLAGLGGPGGAAADIAVPATPRRIVAETHADAVNLRAVLSGDLKCIQNLGGIDQFSRPAPPLQAFDRAADPHERHPLPAADARFQRCRTLLHTLPAGGAAVASNIRPLSPDEQARLRALGYLR